MIDDWYISCEIALRWLSLILTNDKSTLVQIMAWCCQATSQYLCQSWPRPPTPYGVTKPQSTNHGESETNGRHFADDILNFFFFLNEKYIFIQTSLKFVSKGHVNNTYKQWFIQWLCTELATSHFSTVSMYLKLRQFAMPEICESWLVKIYLLCPPDMWKLDHVGWSNQIKQYTCILG